MFRRRELLNRADRLRTKMQAIVSQQANVLHRVFQGQALAIRSGLVLYCQQTMEYGVVSRDQPGGEFFGIDFRQCRHEKPSPLVI
jgi:hypothetical protein